MWLDFGLASRKEWNYSNVTRARVFITIILKISKIIHFWGGSDITTVTLNHIAFFAGVPAIKFRRSQELGLLTRYQAS